MKRLKYKLSHFSLPFTITFISLLNGIGLIPFNVNAAYLTPPNINVGNDSDASPKVSVTDQNGQAMTTANQWQIWIHSYRVWTMFILAIAVMTCVVLMIRYFLLLAKDGANPSARAAHISGIITTFVVSALLGATTMFVGIFFNFIG